MPTEREVTAAAFYVARFTRDWPERPFWMLRRCVVPYFAVGQYLLLYRDGLPIAFAGWACETDGAPKPWREGRYLPSARDIAAGAGATGWCVTELMSPFLPPQRVADAVGRSLNVAAPPWLEYDAERKVVAVHGGTGA